MPITRIGLGFEMKKSLAKYTAFRNQAPKVIANNSLNHFQKGFRTGGGQTDASKSGWQKREPRKNETGSQRSNLIKSGDLRRSLKVISARFNAIVIGTTRIRYAERHNEGLKGMPKREFIGDSKELNKDNIKLLADLLRKVFQR